MKPVVGFFVLLLLAVVATASAMVVEDLEFGESYNEYLELAEKEQAEQTEVGQQESQNVISFKDSESVQPEIQNSRPILRPKLRPELISDLPKTLLPKLPPKPPSYSPPKMPPKSLAIMLPNVRPKLPSANLPTVDRTRPSQNAQCEQSKQSKGGKNGAVICETTCMNWQHSVKCVRRFFFRCARRMVVKRCTQWGTKCSRKSLSVPVRSLEEIQQEEEEAKAEMLAESQKIFIKSYDERVVKAEKYEFSPSDPIDSSPEGEKPVSVVISLADGRKFEVIQEPKLTERKSSTILVAYALTEDWKMVESKDIQASKVIDFVRASDSSVSYQEAVEKMLTLD